MKKILMFVILVIFVIITAMALHNTNKNAAQVIQDEKSSEEHVNTDVVITDSYFIQSTNDIYLNIDNYIGKTIKMEGLIYEYKDYNNGSHIAVVRNSPGCCGNDGLAGLDIEYGNCLGNGTWVEIVGTIKESIIDNQRVPVIEVTSMIQKPEGKTFVTN